MMWVYSLDQMKLAKVHKKLFDWYHGNPEAGIIAAVDNCFSPSDAIEKWGEGSFHRQICVQVWKATFWLE
jgi:hypothetical protein